MKKRWWDNLRYRLYGFRNSSYQKHNYGELFFALMRIYQPDKVVELGTNAGFSAYHIARGLVANGHGSLDCFDLWEQYEPGAANKAVAEKNLKEFKSIITYSLRDVAGVENDYNLVDILHVDLDNSGEVLEKIIPNWIDKVRQLIIIEGGSKERDRVEWMTKSNKQPILSWLENFRQRRTDIEYFTIEKFPSMTLMRRIKNG